MRRSVWSAPCTSSSGVDSERPELTIRAVRSPHYQTPSKHPVTPQRPPAEDRTAPHTRAGTAGVGTSGLVALSSAAILAVYAAGYYKTKAAADRFASESSARRPPGPAQFTEPAVG